MVEYVEVMDVEEVVELAKTIIFVMEDNVHVKPTVGVETVEMMDVEELVEHVEADLLVEIMAFVNLLVLQIVMVENVVEMVAKELVAHAVD